MAQHDRARFHFGFARFGEFVARVGGHETADVAAQGVQALQQFVERIDDGLEVTDELGVNIACVAAANGNAVEVRRQIADGVERAFKFVVEFGRRKRRKNRRHIPVREGFVWHGTVEVAILPPTLKLFHAEKQRGRENEETKNYRSTCASDFSIASFSLLLRVK